MGAPAPDGENAADATDNMAAANDTAMAGNAAMPSSATPSASKPVTIKQTISYRCDDPDKSVVKIDYMSDDMAAMIRMGAGAPLRVVADKPGGPFTEDGGTRLSGGGKEIVLKAADGKTMSCKG